ncbi:dyslexia-associated protein KIAA0319 homolog [Uranotaenia lowii]|uniref:dyslexia-associated protein KIAA0319 homolog n=1 Tax=Uranotaenia lowii TaxID=190385 RepID=UPI00247A0F57|nr:dyslexia-associated protein KIAA0319 homolog [Uranotaenia lowii]
MAIKRRNNGVLKLLIVFLFLTNTEADNLFSFSYQDEVELEDICYNFNENRVHVESPNFRVARPQRSPSDPTKQSEVMWEWNLPDAQPSNGIETHGMKGQNLTVFVTKNGSYSFNLVASKNKKSLLKMIVDLQVSGVRTEINGTNRAPRANAGRDQVLFAPVSAVVLDGSLSTDDYGIAGYQWKWDPGSQAMGTVVDGSDRRSKMLITNIVPGKYKFQLSVTDNQNLTDIDEVSVIVCPDPHQMALVEITLNMTPSTLSKSKLERFQELLTKQFDENQVLRVHIREPKQKTRDGKQIAIQFYVETIESDGSSSAMSAPKVERFLKRKLSKNKSFLGAPVVGIRSVICQNTCSGHGICDVKTRLCTCEILWLPNLSYRLGLAESNCAYSIFYVTLIIFLLLCVLFGICGGAAQWFLHKSYSRNPQRVRKGQRNFPEVENYEQSPGTSRMHPTIMSRRWFDNT